MKTMPALIKKSRERGLWLEEVPVPTVGANAVVPNNVVVPPGALALGVPAKILEGRSDVAMIKLSAAEYVGNVARYKSTLRRLD